MLYFFLRIDCRWGDSFCRTKSSYSILKKKRVSMIRREMSHHNPSYNRFSGSKMYRTMLMPQEIFGKHNGPNLLINDNGYLCYLLIKKMQQSSTKSDLFATGCIVFGLPLVRKLIRNRDKSLRYWNAFANLFAKISMLH